jgi:hypothetical protein
MKRNTFIVLVLALTLSLALFGSAAAQDAEVGFNVDCTGAYGFGSVPAHTIVIYAVSLWDPGSMQMLSWDGSVSGGESGAPFEVNIPWGVEIVPGTDANSSYYWIWINGVLVQESHFECPPPPPTGEGCTPGYWKNHLESWGPTGLSPADDFDATFGVDLFDPDITLEEAVNAKGGGAGRLARHGTAALLSALHPDVGYPYSADEVIALVQAGDADTLAAANELGCPIN